MSARDEAVAAVKAFIDANYDRDHNCGDPNCPGNFYEADDIVHTVLMLVNGEDPDQIEWIDDAAPVPRPE